MHHFKQFTHQAGIETVGAPNAFENFIAALQGKMVKPDLFGWFHLLCLALMFACCVWIVCRRKTLTEKKVDLIMGITASVMIGFEIYKQLVFSYQGDGNWTYQWYIFPFQFCSTPMYVMLLGALIKNEKMKHACRCFMATYGLFAGAAVMFYPGDVFQGMIGINIQTMLHHGIMFVVGVMLYASGIVKMRPKSAIPALPIFFILLTIAMILNLSIYPLIEGDPSQSFNMFYISPYYPCTLPFLSMFANDIPHILFFFIYALGFTGLAFLMPCIALGVSKLFGLISLGISKLFALFTPKKAEETAPQSSENSANNAE